jgi:hypothetical protein
MKTFLLFALSFGAATSWANMNECRQYSKDILSKAVTEDPKVTDGHPYRMNKDEKKALEFINKFDVKKLGFKINKEARTKILRNCEQMANKSAAEVFCNNSFEIYNYFRGLTHGLKYHKWSAATVALGKKQAHDYVTEVTANEPSMLDTILATNVLSDLAKTGLAKSLDAKALTHLSQELDKANIELREKAQNRQGPMDCKAFQEIAAQEIKMNATFSKRLAALNK